MPSVIFTRAVRVKELIVMLYKVASPLRVFPYPIPKSILDSLLFLLCQRRLFGIEDAPFLSVRVLNGVVNPHITEVQRILQNAVSIGALGSVGHISIYIAVTALILSLNVPLRRKSGEVYLDGVPQIKRHMEGFLHELLDIALIHPGCSEPDVNFAGIQVFGLGRPQSLHIGIEGFRERGCGAFRCAQFFPDIAGKVFVSRLIDWPAGFVHRCRKPEDHSSQLIGQFLLGFPSKL